MTAPEHCSYRWYERGVKEYTLIDAKLSVHTYTFMKEEKIKQHKKCPEKHVPHIRPKFPAPQQRTQGWHTLGIECKGVLSIGV